MYKPASLRDHVTDRQACQPLSYPVTAEEEGADGASTGLTGKGINHLPLPYPGYDVQRWAGGYPGPLYEDAHPIKKK